MSDLRRVRSRRIVNKCLSVSKILDDNGLATKPSENLRESSLNSRQSSPAPSVDKRLLEFLDPSDDDKTYVPDSDKSNVSETILDSFENNPTLNISESLVSNEISTPCTPSTFFSSKQYARSKDDEDPFSGSDADRDPIYVPETSTSHYSDSEDSTPRTKRKRQRKCIKKIITPDETHILQEIEEPHVSQKLSRKRKRAPETWKRNKQRQLRLAGKEHLSQAGNIVRAKSIKLVSCKCHYKCNENISEQDRKDIFNDYMTLTDERSRWAYISKCITKSSPKRRYAIPDQTTSKRKCSFVYKLTNTNGTYQVCKSFFMGTLDISGKKIETVMKKSKSSGIVEEDKRGYNPAPNKISEDRKNIVRAHLKSIPVVESHYCRSSSKRMYLPAGLSENRLYRDYLLYCNEYNAEPVSSYFYKHMFTTEFNYSFHKPKKDQCDICAQFKNKSEEEKLQHQQMYDLHLLRKQEAREHKNIDKTRAKSDKKFVCYTMDMEKLLLTPQLETGQLYYKKKMKTFNFTMYDLCTKIAINYMWHETDGTKGASEVATCIWNLLSDLPKEITEVTFYSDTASGQNRNTILAAMFIKALKTFSFEIINQKFMESGHSEMECDSVHSTIENRGRKINIYTPDQWFTIARTAKVNNPPYIVKEMDYSQFQDFKSYSQSLITNKNKTIDGDTMRWLDVKWLQFRKVSLKSIFYKKQLSENEFKELPISRKSTRYENATLNNLYQSRLRIDCGKLKDLLTMCKKGTIPKNYHNYYENLTAAERSTDSNDSD